MSKPFILQEIEDLRSRVNILQQTVDESVGDGSITLVGLQQEIVDINAAIDTLEGQLTAHAGLKNNPHEVTKTQVGLGNVDNIKQEPFRNLGFNAKTNASAPNTYPVGITYLWADSTGGFPYTNCGIINYNISGNHAAYQLAFDYANGQIPRMKVRAAHHDNATWGTWADYYTTANKPTRADVGLSVVDNIKQAPITHVGAGGTEHAAATTTVAGFMTPDMVTKLAGIAAGANNYVHPTGDGNRHVPATGTTNNKKVLMAGATAMSEAWQQLQFADLGGTGNVYTTANKPTRDDVGLGESTSPKFQGLEAVTSLKIGNVELEYNAGTKALEFNVTP